MAGDVVLTGACGWWAESAHQARWGDRDVVAWVGPELGPDPHAVERTRERARPWVGLHHEHVLTLLDWLPVDGRPVWLYPPPDGVSAAVLLRSEREGLPLRPAVELCARVATALQSLGVHAASHPGPELHHLLVSPSGRVVLSHLAGPGPRSPARREPRGREDEVAVVWRLGVLLAELLTGQPPQPASDPAAFDSTDRRLAIRLLARPGPTVPAELRTWLSALLAWDPVDRPSLLRVGPGLTALAASLPGPDLAHFTGERVPGLRSRAVRPSVPPAAEAAEPRPAERRSDRTEEVVIGGDLLDRDDDTAASVDAEVIDQRRPVSEPGAIPVGVGPPVEVLRRLRATPTTGLFRETTSTTAPTAQPVTPPPVPFRTLIAVTSVGLALCAVLTAWLLWGRG